MSRDGGAMGLPFDLIDEDTYALVMDEQVKPLLDACAQDDWLPIQGQTGGIHSVFYGLAEFCQVRCQAAKRPAELAVAETEQAVAEQTEQTVEEAVSSAAPVLTTTAPIGSSISSPAPVASPVSAASGPAPLGLADQRPSIGTVVVSHGFTESALKFAELAWYFLQAGYNVLLVEHRGHGQSLRESADPRVVSIHDWHDYVSDLVGVVKRARLRYGLNGPLLLFGHSMGAAIGAAVLEGYPRLFARAVLSSPMMLPRLRMPVPMAYALSAVGIRSGHGAHKIPLVAEFSEQYKPVKSPGRSQARARWYFDQRLTDQTYQTYSPSFDWVEAALEMDSAILSPQTIGMIETPTLIFHAEDDQTVRTSAQARFVARARRGQAPIRFLDVAGADHEIFAATNDILAPYLRRILSFYGTAV